MMFVAQTRCMPHNTERPGGNRAETVIATKLALGAMQGERSDRRTLHSLGRRVNNGAVPMSSPPPEYVWTLPLFRWAFRRNKVRLSHGRFERAQEQALKYQRNRVEDMKLAKRRGRHSKKEWAALLAFCGHRCVACGVEPAPRRELTKDHIISIRLGGSDAIENLQPLCSKCNCIKGGLGGSTDHRLDGWQAALGLAP